VNDSRSLIIQLQTLIAGGNDAAIKKIAFRQIAWCYSLGQSLREKSATHMQDPFENRPTDTSVTAIARTIEINIKQLLKESEIPQPLPTDKYYLL